MSGIWLYDDGIYWCFLVLFSRKIKYKKKKLQGTGWKSGRGETLAAEVKVTFSQEVSRHGQGAGVKAQGNLFLHITEPPIYFQKNKKNLLNVF
jgi:hypothetical protein